MISALILAAGRSERMGRPKMSLPWGDDTVLGHVIAVFRAADVEDVLVVSGGDRAEVERIASACGARTAFNPHYAGQEMLGSLQVGLQAMPAQAAACLVALGDQPQVLESTVRALTGEYLRLPGALLVPSYQMRRGHPWLVERQLWPDVLRMRPPETPRDFLQNHAADIRHVSVDTPTILQDVDTPDDYRRGQSPSA